jgi:hypothetical protein
MKLGGERLRAQESVSKCLQCENEWPTMLERCGGGLFIAPPRESSRWGVRNPDMSGLGARHVQPTSLELILGTGYSWYET